MLLYGLVLIIHVLVALFLVAVILLQGGRGGLAETMGGAAAQSLFGGGANTVMTRITAVGAGLFMVTCLSLAALSTARGRSVIDRVPVTEQDLSGVLPPPAEPGPSSTATPPPTMPAPTTNDAVPSDATVPAAPPASNEPPASSAPPSTATP